MHRKRGVLSIFAFLAFLSLPLAVAGQWLLDRRYQGYSGWLLICSAAFFLLTVLIRQPVWKNRQNEQVFYNDSRLVYLALIGAVANLSSLLFFGGNRLTWYGVFLWQGGLVLFLAGIIGPDEIKSAISNWFARLDIFHWTPSSYILVCIILVGAAFRLWEIALLPAEAGVDLPLIFMSTEKVLDGEWPIFFTYHPGREGLYIYLAAAFLRLFGGGFPALRTLGALIGTATIPAVYYLARRLHNTEVGLLAAAFFAVSRWHIILSRTGLRFILMPLFCLLLVLALDRAINKRKPLDWALVGLVLGWGFYTYNAWLIMPAVVVGGLCLKRLAERDWQSGDFFLLVFALLIAFMIFVPQARFAYDDPKMYVLRVASRLTSSEKTLPDNILKIIWSNLIRTLGMFNITGDGVAHINVPLKRQLGLVSSALFPLGIAILLAQWRRNLVLLFTLFITCLPTMLSLAFPAEVPNAGRASGVIGFACIVAALPLSIWRNCLSNGSLIKKIDSRRLGLGLTWTVVVAVLVVEGVETRSDYFVKYKKSLSGGNYSISSELVNVIQSFGQDNPVYIQAYPHFYDGNALRMQLKIAGIEWSNELVDYPTDISALDDQNRPIVIVLHPDDAESREIIQYNWPFASFFTHYDNNKIPAFMTVVIGE